MLSIIIPVYNGARTIEECLTSILNQKEIAIEIICVNDMSTDDTLDILLRYAQSNPCIRIVNASEKLGLSHVRNLGLDNIRGDFFTFVDSDDTVSANQTFYNNALKALEEYTADLICYGYNKVSPKKTEMILPFHGKDTVREMTINEACSSGLAYHPYTVQGYTWNKIWRKSVFKIIPRFNEGLSSYEDMVWFVAACSHIQKAICLNELGYNYQYNPSSMTRTPNPIYSIYKDAHSYTALSIIATICIERNISKGAMKIILHRRNLAIWDCFRHSLRSKRINRMKYRANWFGTHFRYSQPVVSGPRIIIETTLDDNGYFPDSLAMSLFCNNYQNWQLSIMVKDEQAKFSVTEYISKFYSFSSRISVVLQNTDIPYSEKMIHVSVSPDIIFENYTLYKIARTLQKQSGIEVNPRFALMIEERINFPSSTMNNASITYCTIENPYGGQRTVIDGKKLGVLRLSNS